jgi:hypothetical protein
MTPTINFIKGYEDGRTHGRLKSTINILTSRFTTLKDLTIKSIHEFKVLYIWPATINIMTSRFATPEGSTMKNIHEFKVIYMASHNQHE